jgi:hypothetical protein
MCLVHATLLPRSVTFEPELTWQENDMLIVRHMISAWELNWIGYYAPSKTYDMNQIDDDNIS